MAIREDLKRELRISANSFDSDMNDLIEEAKVKLKISGVAGSKIDESNVLIKRAIKLYAKANFGLHSKNSEKYQQSFDSLVTHLSLSSDYNLDGDN